MHIGIETYFESCPSSGNIHVGYKVTLELSQAHSARGRLRDKHQIKLRDKLAKLKAEQMEKAVEEGVNEELDPRDAVMARTSEKAAASSKSRFIGIIWQLEIGQRISALQWDFQAPSPLI